MLSVQRATQSAGVTARATYVHSTRGLATRPTSSYDGDYFVRGALPGPAGQGPQMRLKLAHEWNKRMAALATHKREEVSVEELRAMQYIAQQS